MMNKNAGYLVQTADGKRGRTYHAKGRVNGKVQVYLEVEKFKYSEQAILCDPQGLIIHGYLG